MTIVVQHDASVSNENPAGCTRLVLRIFEMSDVKSDYLSNEENVSNRPGSSNFPGRSSESIIRTVLGLGRYFIKILYIICTWRRGGSQSIIVK